MLGHVIKKEIFNGELTVKVLNPEDIIAFKLQAIKNDPERFEGDFFDIREIFKIYRDKMDISRVKQYFELFDFTEFYDKLVKEGK